MESIDLMSKNEESTAENDSEKNDVQIAEKIERLTSEIMEQLTGIAELIGTLKNNEKAEIVEEKTEED